MSVLTRKSSYFNKVRSALLKLADIIDPQDEATLSEGSFYDDVANSVERIADNYSGSISSVLPPVTSEDVGKVLAVDEDGQWAAVSDWLGTKEQYDSLQEYDENTMYYIVEGE